MIQFSSYHSASKRQSPPITAHQVDKILNYFRPLLLIKLYSNPYCQNQKGFASIPFSVPGARLSGTVQWWAEMSSRLGLHNSFTRVFAFRGHFSVSLGSPHVGCLFYMVCKGEESFVFPASCFTYFCSAQNSLDPHSKHDKIHLLS